MLVTVKLTMRNGSKYTVMEKSGRYVIHKERALFGPKLVYDLDKSRCTLEEALARTVKHSGSEFRYHEFFDELGVRLNRADDGICRECCISADTTRHVYIGIDVYEPIAKRSFSLGRSRGVEFALKDHEKELKLAPSKNCSPGRVSCPACHGTGGLASGNMKSGYWVEKCNCCDTKGHIECVACHGTGKA